MQRHKLRKKVFFNYFFTPKNAFIKVGNLEESWAINSLCKVSFCHSVYSVLSKNVEAAHCISIQTEPNSSESVASRKCSQKKKKKKKKKYLFFLLLLLITPCYESCRVQLAPKGSLYADSNLGWLLKTGFGSIWTLKSWLW